MSDEPGSDRTDTPEWQDAREVLSEQRGSAKLERLKQKAAQETILVEVWGEPIECYKPGEKTSVELLRKGEQITEAGEDTDPDVADEMLQEICRIASDLTVEDAFTFDALYEDDEGCRLATAILDAIGDEIEEEVEQAEEFR